MRWRSDPALDWQRQYLVEKGRRIALAEAAWALLYHDTEENRKRLHQLVFEQFGWGPE